MVGSLTESAVAEALGSPPVLFGPVTSALFGLSATTAFSFSFPVLRVGGSVLAVVLR
jgi:hypothetical protein